MHETERASPRTAALETWPVADMLEAMLEGQMSAAASVRAALPSLAMAITAASVRIGAGGRLVYVGAGTSGRIGVQDGAELPPTYNWPRERLVFLIAGGMEALTASIEGAEDDRAAAERGVADACIGGADVVIGVAASGTTPYTIAAVAAARAAGALTIAIANNPDTPLLAAAEHAIVLATGPEVVAGSTRMKAGTAQKIALNLISTALMIADGRVYKGRMVDMAARNVKLDRRAVGMVMELAGVDEARATAVLADAGGSVKLAILIASGMAAGDARTALAEARGDLRSVLGD